VPDSRACQARQAQQVNPEHGALEETLVAPVSLDPPDQLDREVLTDPRGNGVWMEHLVVQEISDLRVPQDYRVKWVLKEVQDQQDQLVNRVQTGTMVSLVQQEIEDQLDPMAAQETQALAAPQASVVPRVAQVQVVLLGPPAHRGPQATGVCPVPVEILERVEHLDQQDKVVLLDLPDPLDQLVFQDLQAMLEPLEIQEPVDPPDLMVQLEPLDPQD
jgi:hypothetical protein